MSPTQKKRLTIVSMIIAGVSVAVFFTLKALDANIEYFRTPTQISQGEFTAEQRYRIAGLVKKGSVSTLEDGITRQFVITDCEHDVAVRYTGILPDLFREGQAIVAKGIFTDDQLMTAGQVLAKHDENYVPNEAADTMMKAQANKCDNADGPVAF